MLSAALDVAPEQLPGAYRERCQNYQPVEVVGDAPWQDVAWEGDDDNEAKWFWFEGNFGAYEENKIERLGAEAARPHRVTHRRLTRD